MTSNDASECKVLVIKNRKQLERFLDVANDKLCCDILYYIWKHRNSYPTKYQIRKALNCSHTQLERRITKINHVFPMIGWVIKEKRDAHKWHFFIKQIPTIKMDMSAVVQPRLMGQ